jgi:hypothetical protein
VRRGATLDDVQTIIYQYPMSQQHSQRCKMASSCITDFSDLVARLNNYGKGDNVHGTCNNVTCISGTQGWWGILATEDS